MVIKYNGVDDGGDSSVMIMVVSLSKNCQKSKNFKNLKNLEKTLV